MKKKIWSMILTVVLGLLMLVGCGTSNKDATAQTENDTATEEEATEEEATVDTYVFIAASLSNAMEEIAELYKDTNPNVNIIYNADSSGTLQTQIEEGARCDVFFSAAVKQMDALIEGGYVDTADVTNLLENKVVLIKPSGGETVVTGFSNITDAANLALAGEDVPVGQYARKIFENLGITDQVMAMEINEGANVTAVLAAVSEKSNEIGIVYATDAMSVKDSVEVIAEATEEEVGEKVIYPVGLVKDEQAADAEKAAAQEFIEFLQTEEVAEIFVNYGFSINN
jgi:molybdate transport system substrate-binding protein